VPESSLLAVEWYLPPTEVVPDAKVFRHVKIRKAVEPTARPLARMIHPAGSRVFWGGCGPRMILDFRVRV
jgi:hypothetical protein